MIGINECCKRIADMVNIAKEDAGIPQTTRLTSIGLSLSGCEQVKIYKYINING